MSNPKEKMKQFYTENGIVETSKVTGLSYQRLIDELDLKYKKFEDIQFTPHPMSGVRSVTMFENGYGASVVSHPMSYGGKMGLYEMAVLDKNGELTYTTPITDDVIGYLTPEQVTEKLIQIQDLKN
jgi:hypothetical protein